MSAASMNGVTDKPTTIAYVLDAVPDVLRVPRRWLLWKWEWVLDERGGGHWTKVPYCPGRHRQKSSTTNPGTWGTFDQARGDCEDRKADGVGFVLGDGWIGFDGDGCRDPLTEVITDVNVRRFVALLNSYTEVSVRGHGLHVLARGTLPPKGRRNGRYELYDDKRFFTMTGVHVPGTPTTVEDRTPELATVHAAIFDANGHRLGAGAVNVAPALGLGALDCGRPRVIEDDYELLEALRTDANGDKFRRLFDHGDTNEYGGDDSRADLALCAMLAFRTRGDPFRIDALFRRSRLYRAKWNERRGVQTYGELTIAKALNGTASLVSVAAVPSTESAHLPAVVPVPAPAVYRFEHAFPSDHLVSRIIDHHRLRTDGAYDFHEAGALVTLANLTPGVRARIRQYAGGLPTNLYVLTVGPTTISRKSASKNHTRRLNLDVAPNTLVSDSTSDEGFAEELAERSPGASLRTIDEFAQLLTKLHDTKYMRGQIGLMLTLYDGEDYTYGRASKRFGKNVVKDKVQITAPHFSILACTTPDIFKKVHEEHIANGYFARFAIVMPTSKPPRLPLDETTPALDDARGALVRDLRKIYDWAWDEALKVPRARRVTFDHGVMTAIDREQATWDDEAASLEEPVRNMLSRLQAMTFKVAMLSAVGRPDGIAGDDLLVTHDDVRSALIVIARWRNYARTFANQAGADEFESILQRAVRFLRNDKNRGKAFRRDIARATKVDAMKMKLVEQTLQDRGLIALTETERGNRQTAFWDWVGGADA